MKPLVRSTSLSGHLANRDNNFDVLRLGAAVMVLVSHSFALTGHHEPTLLDISDTLGFVGVLIFFSISGFLIPRSWLVDSRPIPFAAKRFLRIIPGLLASVLITAYVLGPLVSSEQATSYLKSFAPLHYVLGNTVMLTDYSLPGVFNGNPNHSVNGSLGTLPVEIKAYILILLAGLLVASKTAGRRALLGVLGLLALVASFKTGVKPFWALLDLFCTFAGASGLCLVCDRIRFRVDLFAVSIVVWLLSYKLPLGFHAVLMGLSLPYAVMFLGFRMIGWLRPLTSPGDVSYGVYIYAFPVTQTLVYLGVHEPAPAIGISLPVTYLLAFVSWRLVEWPALKRKQMLARISAPPEPVSAIPTSLASPTPSPDPPGVARSQVRPSSSIPDFERS
jgi:peptidoglycan/LPS O-acetylase OafA/YrhL